MFYLSGCTTVIKSIRDFQLIYVRGDEIVYAGKINEQGFIQLKKEFNESLEDLNVTYDPESNLSDGDFLNGTVGEEIFNETSEIGDNVTIYHNVTLGGISPSINSNDQRNQKRLATRESQY